MYVPGILSFLLVYIEELQTRAVRVEVSQMDGIAMSVSYGIEHLAVIVKSCRAPYDFILAVTINVGY